MHFDKLYTPEASRDLQDIVEKLGLSQVTSYALEKPVSYISFNPDQYQKKLVELLETNPSEAFEILQKIRHWQNIPSWGALNVFPILEEFYDGDESENIEKQAIACSWQDFQRLVSHKGIKLNACTASA